MKLMNRKLLDKTISNHESWLKGDSPHSADFCHKGLWRTNFAGLDLSFANFSGANLKHANFSGATLIHADFDKADLKKANFTEANLTGARFRKANLEKTKFQKAHFDRTDFSGANLTGAHLSEGIEGDCDFTKANLTGTVLKKKREETPVFYLDKIEGEVHLVMSKDKANYTLLTITRKGTLRRAKGLPAHLGFALDNEGRIKLLN